MIQIAPQMRILVAIEGRGWKEGHRLIGPAVPGEAAGGSLLGMSLRVPEPARNLDTHSQLRRPRVLAGAEAVVEGKIRVVAEREGSHPKIIETEAMMLQKLNYIHENPVRRGYVSDPTHWRYSSARNYAKMESLVSVTTDW